MTTPALACIQRGLLAFCGNQLPEGTFYFTNAEHALLYDRRTNPKTVIVACENCCDAIRLHLKVGP
jgi:hypothetical protein